MPGKAIVHEENYIVTGSPVSLTVAVGDRQYGSSMVFLGDRLVANGDIRDLELGTAGALSGETATVYTMVTDVQTGSNDMSVTWILIGGARRRAPTRSSSVATDFGSRIFKGIFHFRSPAS